MSFECLDCEAIRDGYCSDCATPNDELRELIEEWKEMASRWGEMESERALERAGGIGGCAHELEVLVND